MITYGNNASGGGLNAFTIDTTNTNGVLNINGTNNDTINNTNTLASLTFPAQSTGTVFKPDPVNSNVPDFLPLVISDLPTLQLHYNYTDFSVTGSQIVDTFDIPANTFNTLGHVVTSYYGGILSLSAPGCTLNFAGLLGSVSQFSFNFNQSITVVSSTTGSWVINSNIMRVDTNKIRCIATLNISAGTQNINLTKYTELSITGGFTIPQIMALQIQTNISNSAVFKYANVTNNI